MTGVAGRFRGTTALAANDRATFQKIGRRRENGAHVRRRLDLRATELSRASSSARLGATRLGLRSRCPRRWQHTAVTSAALGARWRCRSTDATPPLAQWRRISGRRERPPNNPPSRRESHDCTIVSIYRRLAPCRKRPGAAVSARKNAERRARSRGDASRESAMFECGAAGRSAAGCEALSLASPWM